MSIDAHLSPTRLPVTKITIPVHLYRDARTWLAAHGCQIIAHPDALSVVFPAGTTKAEILPRMVQERYLIRFPDGSEIMEQSLTFMHEGFSLLFLPREGMQR